MVIYNNHPGDTENKNHSKPIPVHHLYGMGGTPGCHSRCLQHLQLSHQGGLQLSNPPLYPRARTWGGAIQALGIRVVCPECSGSSKDDIKEGFFRISLCRRAPSAAAGSPWPRRIRAGMEPAAALGWTRHPTVSSKAQLSSPTSLWLSLSDCSAL